MSKKYLSIGVVNKNFNADKILDPEIASLYPGALWVSILSDLLKLTEFEIHTSDIILDLIQKNIINPSAVYLYCDEAFVESSGELIKLGCHPLILSTFESPIIARKFYSELDSFKPLFNS